MIPNNIASKSFEGLFIPQDCLVGTFQAKLWEIIVYLKNCFMLHNLSWLFGYFLTIFKLFLSICVFVGFLKLKWIITIFNLSQFYKKSEKQKLSRTNLRGVWKTDTIWHFLLLTSSLITFRTFFYSTQK